MSEMTAAQKKLVKEAEERLAAQTTPPIPTVEPAKKDKKAALEPKPEQDIDSPPVDENDSGVDRQVLLNRILELEDELANQDRVSRPSTSEPIVSVTIDLGPSTEKIKINGFDYWHGQTYRVPASLARDLNSIAGNTRMHEEVVQGQRTIVGNKRFRGNKR